MKPKNRTNSLNSHHPERWSSPVNKMGRGTEYSKAVKKFLRKKNRMLLKNPYHWNKIDGINPLNYGKEE